MSTKAGALDRLTDALAGKDVDGKATVAGAIEQLAEMVENGDITIGGGGGGAQMVVHIDGGGYTLRETYQQIKDFIDNNGYNVVAVLDTSGQGYSAQIYQLSIAPIDTYQERIEFTKCTVYTDNGNTYIGIAQLTITPDNRVTKIDGGAQSV